MSDSRGLFSRRAQRNRWRLRARSGERPRMSVFRSNKHIYVQVIDDTAGRTLVSASTVEADMRASSVSASGKEAAEQVGKMIAERALAAGVTSVVFDRGGYRFHGRVKALADAARDAGLSF